ncbi:MAG: hypothetical protein COT43_11785 [Candidatus Marinimicrobia bacterium CG08_land_8_20_14_0_20_45_22]|nr:MAG: hypothetical protein COT43_11785 [Candidatus Marinimicrobia bacterium CG08_land_8_20_14_0_20_45_22]
MNKRLITFFTFILTATILLATPDGDLRTNTSHVLFSSIPKHFQLYTRNENDSATVAISGKVTTTGYDSIQTVVYRNGEIWKKIAQPLAYSGSEAAFSLKPQIHAELSEYKFDVELIAGTQKTLIVTCDSIVCGDAFLLCGQSNSHNALSTETYENEFCRTFGVKVGNSNYYPYNPADTLWSRARGYSSVGPNVGVFGLELQKFLTDEIKVPSCIINGGTGGSIISENLPNSANPADLNTIYGKVLYRVREAELSRIRAMIWYQGENDADSINTVAWLGRFKTLLEGWKTDFQPEKVYVYQIHPGCGGTWMSKLREIQRTIPDSLAEPNITMLSTCGAVGHDGCHYVKEGYIMLARWLFDVMRADFYGAYTDIIDYLPPNIQSANYDPATLQLTLTFDNTYELVWPADTLNESLTDYFYLDNGFGNIASGIARNDSVILTLGSQHFFKTITYLPDQNYNDGSGYYYGPWLKNSRGIGAFSFHGIKIHNPSETVRLISPNGGEIWIPDSTYEITWEQSNLSKIKLLYSADSGQTWIDIADNLDASICHFSWKTPADVASKSCKVRIVDMNNSITADESNALFGIFQKKITVTYPNGGEVLEVGSTITISWTSSFVDYVRIQYSVDNGVNFATIKLRVPAS